jgi:3'(2'), 5'-bisphosphate nucleotidase
MVRPHEVNLEPWRHELDVAYGVVRDATILARDLRRMGKGTALFKADRSPVTVADFAVQAVVARRLGEQLPDDGFVAEEDSTTLRTADRQDTLAAVVDAARRLVPALDRDGVLEAIDRGAGLPRGRFWTLDPVDGTQGFVRGDQYVVALALVVRGQVQLGVLGCPELSVGPRDGGSIVFAVRRHGAFRAPLAGGPSTPLQVSSCGEPRLARVLRSVERDHLDVAAFNGILRALAVETPPMLLDSQAKHALIAAGQAELMLRLPPQPGFRDKIWDQAAGAIVVEEAGGRVTDRHGADLDFAAGRTLARNDGVVVSNGHLHAAVIEKLRRLDADSRSA